MATTQNVFVYGTLMYPQVLHSLLDRVPPCSKAMIHGYKRYAIRGQVFPGTIQSTTGSIVQGVVLFDLTPEDMVIFDEFEGDEYYKVDVEPELLDSEGNRQSGEKKTQASVYIWQDSLRHLLYGDWDPEHFREVHLPSYVEMCQKFATELKQLQQPPTNRPFGFSN